MDVASQRASLDAPKRLEGVRLTAKSGAGLGRQGVNGDCGWSCRSRIITAGDGPAPPDEGGALSHHQFQPNHADCWPRVLALRELPQRSRVAFQRRRLAALRDGDLRQQLRSVLLLQRRAAAEHDFRLAVLFVSRQRAGGALVANSSQVYVALYPARAVESPFRRHPLVRV